MAGTEIETLGDLPYTVEIRANNDWVFLKTASDKRLFCTHDHPLYHAVNGKIEADHLTTGDIVITADGEDELVQVEWTKKKCSLWEVVMPKGHLFWANGFLSHNAKVSQQ